MTRDTIEAFEGQTWQWAYKLCWWMLLPAIAVFVWLASLDLRTFLHAYFFGFLFWMALPLGGLCIFVIHSLTGGTWGDRLQPLLKALLWMVIPGALLAIPVWCGYSDIYRLPALQESLKLSDASLLSHRVIYLSPAFFLSRQLGYFTIWSLVAKFTAAPPARLSGKARRGISGVCMIALVLSVGFAGIDWLMVIEQDWYSSTYGFLFFVTEILAALAFMLLFDSAIFAIDRPAEEAISSLRNDLGNWLLTCVILWAYLAFTQYLIIWIGDPSREIGWYLRRGHGGWQWLGATLVVFHFAVPFFLLFFRGLKRRRAALTGLAGLLLFMHFADLVWNYEPSFRNRIGVDWQSVVSIWGVGVPWSLAFLWLLRRELRLTAAAVKEIAL